MVVSGLSMGMTDCFNTSAIQQWNVLLLACIFFKSHSNLPFLEDKEAILLIHFAMKNKVWEKLVLKRTEEISMGKTSFKKSRGKTRKNWGSTGILLELSGLKKKMVTLGNENRTLRQSGKCLNSSSIILCWITSF